MKIINDVLPFCLYLKINAHFIPHIGNYAFCRHANNFNIHYFEY